jgi:hypothetical protein
MQADHVLIAVDDLETAGPNFEREYGLRSLRGGRHPGWGTANRIIPLGDFYIELIAVIDREEAINSIFGQWILGATPGRCVGWAARTSNIESVAGRLNLSIQAGSRRAPGGQLLAWRSAGVREMIAQPCLPFFIEWDNGSPHPGRSPLEQPAGLVRLDQLELTGDAGRLAEWLDAAVLPISIEAGKPAVRSVRLVSDGGQIALG